MHVRVCTRFRCGKRVTRSVSAGCKAARGAALGWKTDQLCLGTAAFELFPLRSDRENMRAVLVVAHVGAISSFVAPRSLLSVANGFVGCILTSILAACDV